MNYFLFIALLFITSCGIYKSNFDCPPGKGIGCAPVNEVMDLIVENDEGEDVFASDKGTALLLRQLQEDQLTNASRTARKKFYLIKDESGNLKVIKAPKENNS